MSAEDDAILLRTYLLQETSLIAVWLTQYHGIIRTSIKGAYKVKKSTSTPDLFFLCHLQWVSSRSSDLHSTRACDIISPGFSISKDYNKLRLAAYCAQLVIRALESEQPEEQIYHLFLRLCRYLETTAPTAKALLHFEKEFTACLGLSHPNLSPHRSLLEHLGGLPKGRESLLHSLS